MANNTLPGGNDHGEDLLAGNAEKRLTGCLPMGDYIFQQGDIDHARTLAVRIRDHLKGAAPGIHICHSRLGRVTLILDEPLGDSAKEFMQGLRSRAPSSLNRGNDCDAVCFGTIGDLDMALRDEMQTRWPKGMYRRTPPPGGQQGPAI